KGNPGAFGFAFTSNGSVIAATTGPTGAPGGLFLSTDRGASWAYADCCYPRSFAITTNGNIFAGDTYASGGISRSTDQGANWTQVNAGLTDLSVEALAISRSGYIFAGTSSGVFRGATAP